MMANDNERRPLSSDDAGDCSGGLVPFASSQASPISSRLLSIIQTIVKIILGAAAGSISLVLLLLLTATGIGPLIEYGQCRRDKKALDRDALLREHPEMFLLDVPSDVNKASGGKPYRVMVRVTKPTTDTGVATKKLPPIIFPGGLASNLMTMSRHQDELTAKHGFTVVNFDRLGVGLSDPYPRGAARPPSAADVAREMNYVMTHIDGVGADERWIQVGGSMGTNVATALCVLFPNRLCGFFNLDGLPHAFLQIQCKKFLKDGGSVMGFMRAIRWTGLPRLAFTMALRPMLPVMGDAFTTRQMIGVMCREQFFTATGLEYTTLMSCCDLECAAWGSQATTECSLESLRILASMAPDESVIINESNGTPRSVTTERSKSELGTRYLTREDDEYLAFVQKFRELALTNPDEINRTKTHCNWPQPHPSHPVGEFIGGIDEDTTIYPLAPQFKSMVVRIMCARDYTGLERDYTQEARNHAAARCSLQVIAASGESKDNGKVYYYPTLNHMNLWQQVSEVVSITHEMSRVIMESGSRDATPTWQ